MQFTRYFAVRCSPKSVAILNQAYFAQCIAIAMAPKKIKINTADALEVKYGVIVREYGNVSSYKLKQALYSRTRPLDITEGVLKQWILKYRAYGGAMIVSGARELEEQYGDLGRRFAVEHNTGYKLMHALGEEKLYVTKQVAETCLRKYVFMKKPAAALMKKPAGAVSDIRAEDKNELADVVSAIRHDECAELKNGPADIVSPTRHDECAEDKNEPADVVSPTRHDEFRGKERASRRCRYLREGCSDSDDDEQPRQRRRIQVRQRRKLPHDDADWCM